MWPQTVVPTPNAANTLILIGDSITAGGWAGAASSIYNDSKGAWTQANVLLGQRFNILDNKAVSGTNSATCLTNFSANVLGNSNGKPAYVYIHIGTNDVIGMDTTGNLKSMFDIALTAGVRVLVGTILPKGFTTYGSSQAFLAKYLSVNRWLRLQARTNPNIILLDYYSAMLNTATIAAAATGEPIASLFNADLINPIPPGAKVMANVIFTATDSLIPKVPLTVGAGWNGTNGDQLNPILNPWMITGSGGTLGAGATGVIAQNWTLQRGSGAITGVGSKVARTDNVSGEWQRITIGNSGAISEYMNFSQLITVANLAAAGINIGDTCYMDVEMNAAASSANVVTFTDLSSLMLCWDSGYVILANTRDNYSPSNDLGASTLAGVLRTRPIVLPANLAYINFQMIMKTIVAGAGAVDIGRVSIVKV